ncbi:MAG: hypothetical protein ACHQ5A_02945 [Opitutales bacterium]
MRSRRQLSWWLWAGGAALAILAVRLGEIHRYTGDVAINDQWKIEAADLIAPWLDGTLRPWTFFLPHFEHVPVWTRLLAWLEVALTGRWDPLVQATVNSLLYAGFAALLLRWLTGALRLSAAILLTLLVAAIGMLPHGWENTTWGFQSQFPFALLFLFLHADGSFRHAPGSAGWWRAQAAGVAGLFTLASMWMAPLAVVLVSLWTQLRGSRLRLWPLLTCSAGLAIIGVVRAVAPPGGAFAQTAGSPLQFLHALFDLLGWPAGWPGALILLNLPLLLFALQLRGRSAAAAFDRTTLALGVWTWGQVLALAYARSADYSGYVSRYGDLLAIGLLANGIAVARLVPAARILRAFRAVIALAWAATAASGLVHLSTTGHAAYFHENAVRNAQIRRDAVQAYLQHHDRRQLESPETRWRLYQDVTQITSLLDRPDFRVLLPASVNPAVSPNLAGRLVRLVQRDWMVIGLAGTTLALAGLALTVCSPPGVLPLAALAVRPVPWLRPVAAGVGLAAFTLLFCWPDPFTFRQTSRWKQLILPPGSVGPLTYAFVGPAPLPVERLQGAAPLSPPELRDLFCGTAPEGPGLTGTILSSPFTITTPWLVVPHAGFPVGNGNGLRIRVYEADGRTFTEVACEGPNPPEIAFWTTDVRSYQGRTARLVLYDGRTETEAWVAAAPPIATRDSSLAARLTARRRMEQLAPAHQALGWIALVAGLLFAGAGLSRSKATA